MQGEENLPRELKQSEPVHKKKETQGLLREPMLFSSFTQQIPILSSTTEAKS